MALKRVACCSPRGDFLWFPFPGCECVHVSACVRACAGVRPGFEEGQRTPFSHR